MERSVPLTDRDIIWLQTKLQQVLGAAHEGRTALVARLQERLATLWRERERAMARFDRLA